MPNNMNNSYNSHCYTEFDMELQYRSKPLHAEMIVQLQSKKETQKTGNQECYQQYTIPYLVMCHFLYLTTFFQSKSQEVSTQTDKTDTYKSVRLRLVRNRSRVFFDCRTL